MTFQTPAHAQRLDLFDFIHLVDPTVAGNATDAPRDVCRMVEVGVISKIVNLHPINRTPGRQALAHSEQLGAVGMNTGGRRHAVHVGTTVTLATGGSRGDSSKTGMFYRRVTEPTVHFQLAGMERMTEWQWLLGLVTDVESRGRGPHHHHAD